MRIEIEIPKEFEEHFTQNKFKDSFGKIMEEIGRNLRSRYCSYAGRYEYETIEMLQKAFENSRQAYPVEKVVDELEEAKGNVPVNRLLDDIIKEKPKELGQLIAYDKAIEIVKQGGVYTKELFIDRRENSKSLAWSSVLLAFHNIPSIGSVVDRPKALGDIRGVTYIYAMFYRFGLINVPEKAKEKMEPVRNKDTEQMSFV